jgi:hypothetical protein
VPHDSEPHPNGDGLEIHQRHLDEFFTPKNTGFGTPRGDNDFKVVLPGEYIDVPSFQDLPLNQYVYDISPTAKTHVLSMIASTLRTFPASPTAAELALAAAYVRGITAYVDQILTYCNIAVTYGLLQLQEDGSNILADLATVGESLPASVSVVNGTTPSGNPPGPTWGALPTVADLNAMRTAAGPASTGKWDHVYCHMGGNVTSGGPLTETEWNINNQAYLTGLNGGVYFLRPKVALVGNQEYLGYGAANGTRNHGSNNLPFYSNTTLGFNAGDTWMEQIMETTLDTMIDDWGVTFKFRPPDAVKNLTVIATAPGQLTVSWDPPNTTEDYDQSGTLTDVIYLADNIEDLQLDDHDRIIAPSGVFNTVETTSPWVWNPGGAPAGKVVYFRVRTFSHQFGRLMGLNHIRQGEPTAIVSGTFT